MVFQRMRPEASDDFTKQGIAFPEELALGFVLVRVIVGLLGMSTPNDAGHSILTDGFDGQSCVFPQ